MEFRAQVVTAENIITRLTLSAENEAEARRQISAKSLQVLSLKPAPASVGAALGLRKRFALVLFSQELLTLLTAGLNLKDCLEALAEKETHPSARIVLDSLVLNLTQGIRFSQALGQHPRTFPPLYVGLLQAAENTGSLPTALSRYVEYQERIDAVRSKVISASIYPFILLIVGGLVTGFLLCYVVPRFAVIYEGTGRELPWLSGLMLRWGAIVRNNPFRTIGSTAFLLVALCLSVWRVVVARGIGGLLVLLPGVRRRMRIYELSRLYLTLGMLLEGGIPAVGAMRTATAVLTKKTAQALDSAVAQIEAGQMFSTTFEMFGLTTPISLRMITVGERSGQLGSMLSRAAAFYDADIARFIDRFTRAFEPALMAVIGAVVGLIVVLLYLPIFDLAGSIQ
jgi:general secretion pathway protein F